MNKDRRAINLQAVDWDHRDLLEEIAALRARLEGFVNKLFLNGLIKI